VETIDLTNDPGQWRSFHIHIAIKDPGVRNWWGLWWFNI